jgi:hypothetical protein
MKAAATWPAQAEHGPLHRFMQVAARSKPPKAPVSCRIAVLAVSQHRSSSRVGVCFGQMALLK